MKHLYFLITVFLISFTTSCTELDDSEPTPFLFDYCDEIKGVEIRKEGRYAYGELGCGSHDIVLYDLSRIYDITSVWVNKEFLEPTDYIDNPSKNHIPTSDIAIYDDDTPVVLSIYEGEWGNISYSFGGEKGPYETIIHINENNSDQPRILEIYPIHCYSFWLVLTQQPAKNAVDN